MKRIAIIVLAFLSAIFSLSAQVKTLHQLQQDFVDLRFGMFIHYNMPTYANEDWPDPDAPVEMFNPERLDCNQWAKAAKSANMSYGCLTTKHHSGFCIWDTETTDYNVMNSPYGKDVVKEYADAFRKAGLEVMLYYSILDTHHKLRPGYITPEHTDMIKDQLRELLTNYGDITAIIIDGWDAPWSRISYDQIPFEEIYCLIKSIQPECLVMDLNAAKYPAEGMFYTDIKSYEQGAGQYISKDQNRMPALSCYPLQATWFWKTSFPDTPVKDPIKMVNENIVPMGQAHCNFILNVAPNRDGLIDDNAIEALKVIGRNWKKEENLPRVAEPHAPIIASNLAKYRRTDSSWSYDSSIMDYANDDNFITAWRSNPATETPWISVTLDREQQINMIVLTEASHSNIQVYELEYRQNGEWKPLGEGDDPCKVKVHRFDPVYADAVRMTVTKKGGSSIGVAEFGVYNERR